MNHTAINEMMANNSDWTINIITLALAAIAIGVSIFTFVRTRPIEKKQLQLPALLELFKMLSAPDQRNSRGIIFDVYWYLYPNGVDQARKEGKAGRMVFDEGTPIKEHIKKASGAFDQAGVLVINKIVEPKLFFDMYAGMVVRTWNALEEDITRDRTNNEEVCKWFIQLNKDALSYLDHKPPPIYKRPFVLSNQEIEKLLKKS